MTHLADLQREWNSQPEYPEEKLREIAELVRTRSDRMRSQLFARDLRETVASIFVILFFGGYWLFAESLNLASNATTTTGIAILIAGALEIILVLHFARRRSRADFTAAPLKEFLTSEVQMLNRQIALLRHVAWWYLLPLYVGACVFAVGIGFHIDEQLRQAGGDDVWNMGRTLSIVLCLFFLAIDAGIWWMNQNARKQTLEPLRDALQQTCDGLSALDPELTESERGLVEVLANPALDDTCNRPRSVRFVWPAWHQAVVMVFASLGGFFAGMLIQQSLGQPIRYGEWPLLGLMAAAALAVGSSCVRRNRNREGA